MKYIKLPILITFFFFACTAFAQTGISQSALKTKLDSLSYALGVYNASSVKQAGVGEIDFKVFLKGFEDFYSKGTGSMSIEQALAFLNKFSAEEKQRLADANLKAGQQFLAENAKRPGVVVDPSGVQYKVVTMGNGVVPKSTDVVKVHYHGTKIDGTVFDSSVNRGEPTEFPLNRVIKGWTIGVGLMNAGSKYILYIPSELAYGASPRQGGPIGPNEVLIFEVELLEVKAGGQ